MRILVVEDDELLLGGLEAGLGINGFTVDGVSTCADARAALLLRHFDAVVLDLMLPDGSGLDVLAAVRARRIDLPVVMLTARDSTAERIAGLEQGADDYVGKPFDLGELVARLRAVARRNLANGATTLVSTTLVWRDVTLDTATMAVTRGDRTVRLSRREFSVLHALMRQPGAVLSKSQLEERLYGWQEDIESNTVEVHVHHIRGKLGADAIETVRGVGYRMAELGR